MPDEDKTEHMLKTLGLFQAAVSQLSLSDIAVLSARLNDPTFAAEFSDNIARLKTNLQVLENTAQQDETFVANIEVRKPQSPRFKPTVETSKANRRAPTDAFEYSIYRAIAERRKPSDIDQEQRGLPVGQKELFELLLELDPATKRASFTTKLNRKKQDGYLEWDRPRDMKITAVGRQEMDRLKGYLAPEDKSEIRSAFKQAWDMDIDLT